MNYFFRNDVLRELTFKMSRSGGKGGQNVNKVSSKVELDLHIGNSTAFTDEQKALLIGKLANKINALGILQIITQEERNQFRNKQRGIEKLFDLLNAALHQPKKRKAAKPKKSATEDRLKSKLLNAQKKINRSKYFGD
ncbi:MAG: aminoacyl-tRNA hydrolase [Methylotenera sp.]|nr:aminoacyl-tRNA hydrolase [Flavobacterium sp.]